jgi:hypothetical protein
MMPLLRASLVVLCLAPPLAVAAPAPTWPRPKRDAEPHPWGEPVAGLRARLVPAVSRCPLGGPFRLYLELQNVSGHELSLVEPYLPSYVSHPNDGRVHDWVIAARRLGDEHEGGRPGRAKMYPHVLTRLGAGKTLRIEVTVCAHDKFDLLPDPPEDDQQRRTGMSFDGDVPGTYEFCASFRRSSRGHEKAWDGDRLSTRPVRIELE